MSEEKKITFGRIFWPSLVAFATAIFLGLMLFFLLLGGVIGSFASFGPEPYDSNNASVLRMNLKGTIQEKSNKSFDPMSITIDETLGLPDILFAIEQAKNDDNIKGIYLDIGELNCGISSLRSIRSALDSFRKDSKKFVVAYFQGESVSQKEYYLGSVANECYAFPSSTFYLTGLGSEAMFFKKMLDKLEVEVQVVRGENNDFKSAVEPFYLEKLSDSARLQNQRLMDCIWGDLASDMASSRKFSVEKLNQWVNTLEVVNSQMALKNRLIDGILYEDEMMAKIAKKLDLDDYKGIEFANFSDYAKKTFYENQVMAQASMPSIAVIIGEGEVSEDGEELSSAKICKLFSKVRNDENIKAVVFRINSPGGSALASEEIWREVMLTQKNKKVYVSMGDVAASGGYYIATPADRIFAEPTTITGSIGVFGMIPYTGKMLENKLGITFDRVQTHNHGVMTTNRKLSPEELSIVQNEVNGIYNQFLQRVADGRKMTKERVNQLARGRVWSGKDALRFGLVDQLATLPEVIAFAQKEIEFDAAEVIYYPLVKEDKFGPWIKLINEEMDDETSSIKVRRHSLPESITYWFEQLKKVENKMGIQMRMPYELVVSF